MDTTAVHTEAKVALIGGFIYEIITLTIYDTT